MSFIGNSFQVLPEGKSGYNRKFSGLFVMVWSGLSLYEVEWLLLCGAEITLETGQEVTSYPLLAAAYGGYDNVARLLLKHGANVNC